jgi:hypothetical protein
MKIRVARKIQKYYWRYKQPTTNRSIRRLGGIFGLRADFSPDGLRLYEGSRLAVDTTFFKPK